MNVQSQIKAQARHLVGTAYIVYGPGVTPSEPNAQSHSCSHSHSHQHDAQTTQDHFWAIFRPSVDTPLPSSIPASPLPETPTYFVLRGVPHPWGSYPPDIVEPHGCIPPHLYYSVNVSEHSAINERAPHQDRRNSDSVSDKLGHVTLDDNSNSNCTSHIQKPLQEWTLPFVHRLGDGHDHAGGLTTAYGLLQDLEDAEDFGEFIKARVTQIEAWDLSCPSRAPPIPPSMYACTEVLVSEQRMKQMIDRHFFGAATLSRTVPAALSELRPLVQGLEHSFENNSIWLAKSDLTLLLPKT